MRAKYQEDVMTEMKFDSYSIYARAFPIYITLLPVALVLFPILPAGYDWKLGGATAVVLLPLCYLCRQIGGDKGRKLESALWDKWGGPPTTRFLRHCNSEFNQVTRNRIHDKLRSLGLQVPSQNEQDQNARAADIQYESCTDELRHRTRDSKRFYLVFTGLTEYGFRRNLLGLKPVGLLLTILSFVVCLVMMFVSWDPAKPSVLDIAAGFLNIVLLINWLLGVTENSVKLTADRYARFLLEAALDLEVEDGNNSLPER